MARTRAHPLQLLPPQGERRGVSDYLLDTDVLIRCLRGVAETLTFAQQLTEQGDLHTSVWSHLEIWLVTQPNDQKQTQDFLTPFIAHPVNEEIARRAAELLRLRGETEAPLTYAEAVIAATALHHGLTLVTYNTKNLESLMPLRLINSNLSRGAP
ncbi:MAG: type II toxin-antitoxin system VapC family toxin [Chloroflexota bacterium]|nr:MAG: type II toxin-antitoxin system VapC family toxin [Chloroflexota bacterium]